MSTPIKQSRHEQVWNDLLPFETRLRLTNSASALPTGLLLPSLLLALLCYLLLPPLLRSVLLLTTRLGPSCSALLCLLLGLLLALGRASHCSSMPPPSVLLYIHCNLIQQLLAFITSLAFQHFLEWHIGQASLRVYVYELVAGVPADLLCLAFDWCWALVTLGALGQLPACFCAGCCCCCWLLHLKSGQITIKCICQYSWGVQVITSGATSWASEPRQVTCPRAIVLAAV